MNEQDVKTQVNERRKYRSARRKKKRNRFLVIFISAVVIFGTLVGLSLTVFFPIKTINVTGNEIYSEEQILSSSGVVKGDNLILASSKRANSSICLNNPYVESVAFKRSFPFTLNIVVKESSVFAQIKQGKQYIRINSEGKMMEITNKYQKGSPVITGTTLSTEEVGNPVVFSKDNDKINTLVDIKSLLMKFEEEKLSGITVINLKNDQDIRVTYKNKIVLLLGSNSNLDQKIVHAIATIKQREDNDESGTLNLSRIPGKKNEASFIPKDLDSEEVAGVEK